MKTTIMEKMVIELTRYAVESNVSNNRYETLLNLIPTDQEMYSLYGNAIDGESPVECWAVLKLLEDKLSVYQKLNKPQE